MFALEEDEEEERIKAHRCASEILPHKLFLSSCDVAGDPITIRRHSIRGIISLGDLVEVVGDYVMHPDVPHLIVPIRDHASEPIHEHFDDCINFIAQTEGAVLVHCAAGVSRSATIVMAYLIAKQDMTYQEAHQHVKACRPIVRPNDGFRRQLEDFWLSLKK